MFDLLPYDIPKECPITDALPEQEGLTLLLPLALLLVKNKILLPLGTIYWCCLNDQ